jgi:hypothetical protein
LFCKLERNIANLKRMYYFRKSLSTITRFYKIALYVDINILTSYIIISITNERDKFAVALENTYTHNPFTVLINIRCVEMK